MPYVPALEGWNQIDLAGVEIPDELVDPHLGIAIVHGLLPSCPAGGQDTIFKRLCSHLPYPRPSPGKTNWGVRTSVDCSSCHFHPAILTPETTKIFQGGALESFCFVL